MQFLAEFANPSSEVLYMNYTYQDANGQMTFSETPNSFLMIPSQLARFSNSDTTVHTSKSGRMVYKFNGTLGLSKDERRCPECGGRMHINGHHTALLRHLSFGAILSCVSFDRVQLLCQCGYSHMQEVPFKADGHRITKQLYQYTRDLLATGTYTLKQVAEITGLGKNTVKAIDKKRLQDRYTIDGKELIKPEQTTRILGIDEFKLHDGYRYATHIIDLETGHVLWISYGKKRQVVYDFIDHVGEEWMDNVEAIACDMNSDFQEAFEERCSHIQPVFDYFHIVKNFNDKVVSEVRKDEQRRLVDEGNEEAAKALKKTKYILTSKRSTLQAKDAQARTGKPIKKSSELFPREEYVRKEGYEKKYDDLLEQNKLLFTLDLIKERLTLAYSRDNEGEMANDIEEIMDICVAADNEHLTWFGKLLSTHFEGIIAHATYKISSGRIEGINNKIKTLRRQAYGLPDDEYFFLRIMDISRKDYVRNPSSHKICD